MGLLEGVFGSKPTVPDLQKLNLGKEQQAAIKNNIAAAPEAAKLADLTRDEILSLIRSQIPNFDTISGTASSNIESMLKGQIPTDVSQAVQSSAAARALGGGFAGSGMGRNLVARDLGLTSLDLTQKGLSSAESWLKTTEQMMAPAMATYTSMFVTPMQQAGFDVEERNLEFQKNWLSSQISAMPNPGLRGIHDTIMQMIASFRGNNYSGGMNWGQSMGNVNSGAGWGQDQFSGGAGAGGAGAAASPEMYGPGMT